MIKRKAITPAMKINCLLSRWFTPCGLCGQRLNAETKIEWDHIHALVHNGPHEYANLMPVHVECHKRKSAKDAAANYKVKRLQSPRKSKRPMKSNGRKLPSKPFPKRFREAIGRGSMK